MKKLLTYLFLALSLVTLAACGKNEAAKLTSSTNNHQSKVQGQVTLILKTEKESKKKSVEIQKGDTVLDVLEEVYPVQENDGFITEIDGISQDKDKGIYWMFDVNGKLGEKAANNLRLKMVMRSNSIKKSIIKILNSVSESFLIKFGNSLENLFEKVGKLQNN